jgi:hypothetical protein
MNTTAELGTGPICLCRDRIPVDMLSELDEWTPKHFDDSLQHPAVIAAASFAVLNEGYNGESDPNRLFIYTARDIDGLISWIDSPELRAAIEDGAERESKVLGVDGEPFTGNIYAVGHNFTNQGGNSGRRLVAVERYEVPAAWGDEFGSWLNSRLSRISEHPGVRGACTWTQKRDVPRRFPYDRYSSPGNRMLTIEIDTADGNPADVVAHVDALLSGAEPWKQRLPYFRRDIAEQLMTRPIS